MKRAHLIFWGFIGLWITVFSTAARGGEIFVNGSLIEYKSSDRPIPINSYVEYYADRQGEQTIESIVKQPPRFKMLDSKSFFSATNTHWYKMHLENVTDATYTGFISTGVASPLKLNAYWVSRGHIMALNASPAASRFASHTNTSVPISLGPREQGHLYLEYQSVAHFPLSIHILSPQQYLDRSFTFTLANGMALGALCVFLLFFVVQFTLHKRAHLGFYCLFILSILLFALQVIGYGIQTVWPQQVLLNNQVTFFLAGCIYLFYFLFSVYLFDHSRFLRRAMLAFSVIIAAVSISGFIFSSELLLTIIVAAGLPLPIISAFYALDRQRLTAIFFIVGSCLHYLLTCLLLLMLMGVPLQFNVFALATLGQLADIICFSAAILIHNRKVENQLTWQVRQRLEDMRTLAASEQQATQLRLLNKDSILNSATTEHDLLQVLASIRLQIALQDSTDPVIAQLNAMVDYASGLLNHRVQKGKHDFASLNTQQNIESILEQIAKRYQPSHSKLRFKAQPKAIICSELVINRIIDNLLSNALKHARGNDVLLTGRRRGQAYLIQVWDRGQGIPDDKLRGMFEPFTQLSKNDIKNWGFGLGLYIVRLLCEDSGYDFCAQTKPGYGTCFTIKIHEEY